VRFAAVGANAVADRRAQNNRALLCSCYAFLVVPEMPSAEYVFYDGHCGLCHWVVKFVLKHYRSGQAFRFAPLQGEAFEARVPVERRAGLPDSFVVLTREGALLVRSNAFLHILRRLGGGWAVLAAMLGVIPRGLRDFVYNFIARIRHRVFGRRDEVCPIVPVELRVRFDL
jgi:predicted DCC family thiol-disulfide oxidoreductase YuxK